MLRTILCAGLLALPVGCTCQLGPGGDGPEPDPEPGDPVPASPVRRLTTDELNRTLRDLFPRATFLPAINVAEDRGKDFAQEVQRQVVSDLYVEQLRAGAFVVAEALAGQHETFMVRLPTSAQDERAVFAASLRLLLPRAFRRPVDDAEIEAYLAYQDARAAAGDPYLVRLQLVLSAIIQSPHFLYRLELSGDPDDVDDLGRVPVSSVEMASRLSYFFTGSMPDDELLQAGFDGELATAAGVRAQVDRLLAEPRFVEAMVSFHSQWLDFDRILRTNKSPERFPQYGEALRQAMRTEADEFIALLATEDPSLRALLTSRRTRVSPELAAIYDVTPSADGTVTLDDDRSGVLTQAQFVASHGHALEGSPVLRGVFILERLVCEAPPVPDASIDITPPEGVDDVGQPRTNRDRYARHTDDPQCVSCHRAIDGIGFGLEGYDSVGQHRTIDNGLPVDESGTLEGTRIGGTYVGARALGAALTDSDVVHDCVARHWFRFANGRREQRDDEPGIATATAAFGADDTAIPTLLRAIVETDAFRFRRAP